MARKFLDDKRDAEAANINMENDSHIEDMHKLTGIQLVTGTIQKKIVEPKTDLKTKKWTKADLTKDDKVHQNDPQKLAAKSDMEDDESDSEQKALDVIWANWTPEQHQVRHHAKPQKAAKPPSQMQPKLVTDSTKGGPSSSLNKPRIKSLRPFSDKNNKPKSAKVSKNTNNPAHIIDELFHYEGHADQNENPGAGRERLNGTAESPSLLENHQTYDYGNDIFDSRPDSFDTQWAAINEIYEDDKGFTTSDEGDEGTKDEMKAAGWVTLAYDNEAGNTEAEDGTHSSMRTSPGVLSDNADL